MRTSLILLVLVLNAGISLAQNVHPHSLQIDRKNKTTFFIENKGQWDSEVLYLARLNGMSAWITKSGVVYDYYKIETDARHLQDIEQIKKSDRPESLIKGHVVRMDYGKELLNKEISFSGINKQSSYFNYFIGNDPAKWSSYVGLYDKAIVRNVFDGIDARYYFDNNSTSGVGNDNPIQCFRYDFIVNPGSDPTQIKMDFRGQDGIYIGENQELVIKTSIGEIKNAKIYAYQEKNEIIQQVECYFHQNPDGSISFSIGNYDKTMVLIIDPLVYSTFIGGSGDDEGYSIQSDAQGYTYITGATISKNYPTTIGAYDARGNDNKNAIISKLNPQGTDLIFSTYIGGSNYEEAYKIAIDSSGYSYITGNTMSSDFPTTYSVYDRDFNGGDTWGDVFLSKIDSSGSWLVYSTFLGGNGNDIGYNVSVDQSGFAFLTGKT
jgi:hypothetical protein